MQTNSQTIEPKQRVILARVRDTRFRGRPAEVLRYIKTRDVVVTRLDDGTRYDTPPANLDVVKAALPKAVPEPEKLGTNEYATPRQILRQLRKPGSAYLAIETSSGNMEVAIEKSSLIGWLNDCAPNLECGFRGIRRADDQLLIRLV